MLDLENVNVVDFSTIFNILGKMFTSSGRLQIDNGVRIIGDYDIVRYYQRLFQMAHWNTVKSQLPAHGLHLSIYLPDIHGKNVDVSPIKHLIGERIEFEYDPEDIVITKKNVWVNVKCPRAQEIKDMLKIVDKNFWGFHCVLLNFKGL
jgi:hypothetical protein